MKLRVRPKELWKGYVCRFPPYHALVKYGKITFRAQGDKKEAWRTKGAADESLDNRPRVTAILYAKTRHQTNEKLDFFTYSNNERVE